jgi:FixJ family two-component response regulator
MNDRRKKVIVVDDSEICRETVRDMLEEGGMDVVTLDSPFGLSRTMQSERPDLVLVDVQMPALRGDQLVSVVLQHRLHRCPIVLHSDRPPSELADLTKKSGASGFICKTDDSATFLREIYKFI